MDFRLTSEQSMMRDSVRRMVDADIEPVLQASDRTQALGKEQLLHIFRKLADFGLMAPRLPEAAGGGGFSMLDYGIMFEQIPPSVSMSLVSQDGCITRLFAECDEAQRARFLPGLIAGELIGCTGSTEPGTGSDPRGITTKVTRDGDMLVLNGAKMWVTNISVCDLVIVTCLDRTEDPAGQNIVKVVVERSRSPFEAREIDAIGLQQGLLGEAVFDNCRVPMENMIRSRSGGTQVLKSSWAVNRPLLGLQAVHLAQRAFDAALDYARTRTQFGKPIGARQLVQKSLSDIETAIRTSRLLCYDALATIDAGGPADGTSAMAKRYAQMACTEAVWQAMNVLGAMGLSREARLEEYYRDIRMIPIPDGTNEILSLIHGRELTGLEAIRA
ncbi:Acyl-CoA dehydrogenase [Pigmentiphaga humi]|uniref:Acyl-CoA dehydrogenase n=1 Tax=Pigmentiphaga humi TaxID=2478468 RepID=A0A3P4AWR9_9BURK|nr:acyl-CoA dehydrogenase family protein [Pigmentiphaga humi]VCU68504.1 Acyl-CoA dehydrogenase [Pigmentiphaga humi]